MVNEAYETIVNPVSFELKEKGSKFLAFAFPVEDEKTIKWQLEELKSAYSDATHHCYAYKLLDVYRANDDGEPKNSAGLPIYRQILSEKLDFGPSVIYWFSAQKVSESLITVRPENEALRIRSPPKTKPSP